MTSRSGGREARGGRASGAWEAPRRRPSLALNAANLAEQFGDMVSRGAAAWKREAVSESLFSVPCTCAGQPGRGLPASVAFKKAT